MHWVENVILIGLFVMSSLVLAPFVVLKVALNMFTMQEDLIQSLFYIAIWLLTCPIYIFFFAIKDTFYLIKILGMHQGCREGIVDELDEDQIPTKKKVVLYNEVREAIILLYKKIKLYFDQEEQEKMEA